MLSVRQADGVVRSCPRALLEGHFSPELFTITRRKVYWIDGVGITDPAVARELLRSLC